MQWQLRLVLLVDTLVMHLFEQCIQLLRRDVQSLGLTSEQGDLGLVQMAVFHHDAQIGLEHFALFVQLVTKSGRQQSRRNRKNTDS